jgi:riboflavin kinase/FMN adenylyltransferase
MDIHHYFSAQSPIRGVQHVALGFFDGVHRGHQAVIAPPAGSDPRTTAVLTFHPHPLAVLQPDRKPPLLTGQPHKTLILERMGVGHLVLVPFTQAMALLAAEAFERLLLEVFPDLISLSIGPNFRYGHRRQGGPDRLAAWGRRHRINVLIHPPVLDQETPISSSLIRERVQTGDLAAAGRLLGRPYRIMGQVVHGDGLGRQIGCPTANLQTEDECFPPHGVYAARVRIGDGVEYPAAMNLGSRPTVASSPHHIRIECHLLGFTGDLYGQTIFVEPTLFLRPEMRFPGLEELKQQIGRDIEKAGQHFQTRAH